MKGKPFIITIFEKCNKMTEFILKGKPLEEVVWLANTSEISGIKYPQLTQEYDSLKDTQKMIKYIEEMGLIGRLIEADEDCVQKLVEIKEKGKNILVINYSEGINGADREAHAPAVLELLGIPYTGGGILNKVICINKPETKKILRYHGIPTPNFDLANDNKYIIDPKLSFPLFLKPSREGSSIGITSDSLVHNPEKFYKVLTQMLDKFKQPILIEEYMSGKEFSVGLLGNSLLPLIEKSYTGGFQSDDVKYTDKVKYLSPAKSLSKKEEEEIKEIARISFDVTHCLDLARLDIKLDDHKSPFVLEINAPPGIHPGSSFTYAMSAAEISPKNMINEMIKNAIKRYQ